MPENVIEMVLNKQKITLDVDLDTSISDLTADMDSIASQIAWYGRVYAAAQRSSTLADANYRAWRATVAEDALAKAGGKLAEHIIKNKIEADPQFVQHKETISYFEELATRLAKALVALEVKADILRSRAASERAEWSATGMVSRTPDSTPARVAPPDRPDKPREATIKERDTAIGEMFEGRRRRRPQPESTPKKESE